MYRINIGSLKTMLEATTAYWTGLEELFANLKLRLSALEGILLETLREAVLIKDRMRNLEDVLQGEEPAYNETILRNDAEYGSIIGFDETKADALIQSCSDVSDQAEELQLMVEEITGKLDGIVDLSMESTALTADSANIQNLRNYANAYRDCGEDMEELNTYLL